MGSGVKPLPTHRNFHLNWTLAFLKAGHIFRENTEKRAQRMSVLTYQDEIGLQRWVVWVCFGLLLFSPVSWQMTVWLLSRSQFFRCECHGSISTRKYKITCVQLDMFPKWTHAYNRYPVQKNPPEPWKCSSIPQPPPRRTPVWMKVGDISESVALTVIHSLLSFATENDLISPLYNVKSFVWRKHKPYSRSLYQHQFLLFHMTIKGNFRNDGCHGREYSFLCTEKSVVQQLPCKNVREKGNYSSTRFSFVFTVLPYVFSCIYTFSEDYR